MDSLLQRISDLSPEELSRLAMQYKDESPSSLAVQAIPRRQQANNLPLSFSQQRLWFLDQLFPGLNAYNIPFKVRLKGSLRVGALAESLNVIIGRHEALRTRFATVNGQPVQVIDDQMQLSLPVVDFKAMTESDGLLYAERIAGEEGLRPFDLGTGPLMRAMVLRLTPEDHIVLITMHHIISDGWSMERFLGELTGLYAAYVTGNPIKLPELPIQYGDFAVWQRDRFQGDDLEAYLSYWKEALGEEMPPLDLPTDRPRPPVQSFRGECQTLYLDESLTKALNVLSQRASATLFMTLLAAFKVLLYRYCGQNEILVGTPVAGRTRAELEPLIGFFVNTLVLRSDLSDDPGFLTLLGRVREAALGAYAHQEFPFEKLVEALQLERDLSRSPVFQVWFNLTNFSGEQFDLSLPDLTVENFYTGGVQSKFDLTVYAEQKGESIKLDLVYSTDLFDADTMTEMLGHYEKLLESVVRDPNARVSTVGVGESERRLERMAQMIETPQEFKEMDEESTNQTIGARFEEQASRYPERVAIATSEGEISYGELKERTNRIARQISGEGARGRGQVALLLSHGARAVAGIMGALKAGKTYVPMDGTYPRQRLKRMLEDSESTLIVTDEANRELAEELSGGRVAVIDIDSEEREENEEVEKSEEAEAGDIAYILYTSGSTGEPKGVMQSHRNVLRHIRNYTNVYRISKEDRLTQVSSYGFDGAVMDIMGALMNGASLHPVNLREEGVRRVVEVIERERVTIYHSTPTVFRYLMSSLRGGEDLSSVRVVVMGGEEVYRKDWEQYRKHFSEECVFANGLGPSESSIGLIWMGNKHSRIRGDSVPVGYAVEGMEVRLMDERGRQAATRGEIAMVSEEVALGYWRKAKQTSEAFIEEEGGNGRRMYLTGDLGRRRVDGSIEYLGRKDRQVKVRGYRVELGEIEAAMEEQEWVKEAVVVAREDERGEKRLIGYVVEEEGREVREEEVRRRVREKLPEYMVPVTVMKIREAPLTPNGKIDHRALPEPKLTRSNPEFVAPRTASEQALAAMWQQVLNTDQVGVTDNFFALGGHSLMVTQVISRIREELKVELPLRMFFEAPTVEGLAGVLSRMQLEPEAASVSAITRIDRDSQSLLQRLDELSESEMDSLLSELVNSGEVNE